MNEIRWVFLKHMIEYRPIIGKVDLFNCWNRGLGYKWGEGLAESGVGKESAELFRDGIILVIKQKFAHSRCRANWSHIVSPILNLLGNLLWLIRQIHLEPSIIQTPFVRIPEPKAQEWPLPNLKTPLHFFGIHNRLLTLPIIHQRHLHLCHSIMHKLTNCTLLRIPSRCLQEPTIPCTPSRHKARETHRR